MPGRFSHAFHAPFDGTSPFPAADAEILFRMNLRNLTHIQRQTGEYGVQNSHLR